MKRRMTAVLAIGAVLGMTGCGNFPEIMDETVATTQAAQETTSSAESGPPKEEAETVAPFPDSTEDTVLEEPEGLREAAGRRCRISFSQPDFPSDLRILYPR